MMAGASDRVRVLLHAIPTLYLVFVAAILCILQYETIEVETQQGRDLSAASRATCP